MRVLIVDDSPEVRRRLRALLGEMAGAEVVGEAATVARAIERARACSAELVILDLGLPDGSGFDVLATLRQMSPRPAVVIFTNCPDTVYRRRSTELGAIFLDKSRDLDHLRQVVESLLQQPGEAGAN